VTGVIRRWPLASFVVLAYAISWAWAFPFVAVGDVVEKGVGWPTNFPALLGPALAAFVVTALVWGREAVRDLLARMGRWRMPFHWWAATLSPLAFLAVALGVAAAIGKLPRASGFGRYSGFPAIGVVPVAVVAILVTFGEETGWRGFALPLLQRRYGALAAALLVTPIWALWHLPYFFTVSTYRGFAPIGYVGFVFGLACGSIVLTWLYNGTGGSILSLRDLARPLQPRDRHGGCDQHDPGGDERLRVRPGVPARRTRVSVAEAWRAIDPRPTPRRRTTVYVSHCVQPVRKHLQRFGNLFVIGLLRSPFHRLASGSLLLITYRGRTSGHRFTLPVMYAEREGTLTIFVGHPERKRWWRNLSGGAEVEVRLRGRHLQGHAEVVEDRAAADSYLDRFPRARTAIEAAEAPTFVRVGALTPVG
jgi:membrane protease YdiL (CAAX protease family)